jgi:predicted transcriptional regulator
MMQKTLRWNVNLSPTAFGSKRLHKDLEELALKQKKIENGSRECEFESWIRATTLAKGG